MKRSWRLILIFAIMAIAGPIIWVGYFFVSNDAPIISGEVIYGQEYKQGLKLDIYQPTIRIYEDAPVIIYIHGGAWITGAKEVLNMNRYNKAAKTLRDHGYAIVSINYTLAETGRSPFPACIIDAADAVSWIRKHAEEYLFDTSNIGLFGESAGAHIAMMLAYADTIEFSASYIPTHFNYVIDIYGPNRLQGIYQMPIADSLYSMLEELPATWQSRLDLAQYVLGFDPKQDTFKAQYIMEYYSPYNYVSSRVPPTLLIQGDKDRIVPVDQTILLQEKLDRFGIQNEMHIVADADHGFIGASERQKMQVQDWIVSFIETQYQEH